MQQTAVLKTQCLTYLATKYVLVSTSSQLNVLRMSVRECASRGALFASGAVHETIMFANGTKGASSTLAAGPVTVSLGVGDRVDYSAGTGKGEGLRGGVINPLTLKSDDEGTVVTCFDPVDATDCLQRALIGASPVVTIPAHGGQPW